MKIRHKSIIYIILAVLAVSFTLCSQVWGEETEESSQNEESAIETSTSTALQISPVSTRIGLESGKTVERTFNIKNGGDSALKVRVYAAPYTVGDEDYTDDFVSQTQYTKISKWISFLDSDGETIDEPEYTLEANDSISVKYRITVPEDTASGGQYACIFAETIDETQNVEGIKTIARAGLSIFGNVAGDTRRLAKIGDIDINSLLYKGKVSISSNVENVGNIDFQTSVDINIRSFFGKQLYTDQLVYTVFPETTRRIYTEWDDTPFYGIFRLKTKVTALGTEVESERLILVMPPIMIALTIVIIAGVTISLIIFFRKKIGYKSNNSSPEITI